MIISRMGKLGVPMQISQNKRMERFPLSILFRLNSDDVFLKLKQPLETCSIHRFYSDGWGSDE